MTMRLGTRLTWTFLAALAAVLVGFSTALYAMAAKHLHRQADERLDSALNTLAAAAEVGPDGIEWEPRERTLLFGRRALEGAFAWRVGDDRGRRVDGSASGAIDQALAHLGAGAGPSRRLASAVDEAGGSWRAMTARLDRPRPPGAESIVVGDDRHEALILGASASMEAVKATLRNLALTLAGLSTAVWMLGLGFGRRLCRIALRPVTEMAEAARAIGGDDPGRRLPTPGSDDELEELGRSFNALLDRLGESLERQGRFTGDASHQLRTPLTAILGHADLALRQDRSPDEYRRVLTVVRAKARHLRQIVEGLLFLARADAEARRPEVEPVALDLWLRDHLDAWPNPRRSDLADATIGPGPFLARVQPALLGELVDNLLDNAAKYGPAGSPIAVRLSRSADVIALAVSDGGPGIDRVDLPHLFDPFFRAEAARARGSTGVGLGLSIAARLADVFQGRLVAESPPGQGARFTLTLPAIDAPSPHPAPEEARTNLSAQN